MRQAVALALAVLAALPGWTQVHSSASAQSPAELDAAAGELAQTAGLLAAEPVQRPLRSSESPMVSWPHHAGPERYSLPMPFGEPQFEHYRSAYQSQGGQAWIAAISRRSQPYAAYVRERLRFYGMPEELFYLPFIESEYSPRAVSKSGAAGLWQFMKNSVAGYNMRIDEWLDERRDFMKSTDGALRKLQWNYERFGDWLLAIAAYNCGAGAMDRAIAASGGSRDYWSLRERSLIPPETRSYIPKFLAVAWVAMHAGRNGIEADWPEAFRWATVPVSRPVDLAMLAKAAGVPEDELKAGNAELRYGVTPPTGGYLLKVPEGTEAAILEALASPDRLMSVYLHQVRSGDTVSALARHYDVPVSLIASLNPGLNPDRIRIGQTIAVPTFKERAPYSSASGDDQLVFGGRYTVRPGDTLWSISLVYGVQPETLAERNGLTLTSVLREGISLNVPILE
ncbi:MAG: LysM peptidoglycan-binding domain-containing protein [Spirochaetales bacterium]|nr:LysM peptidoglycan-binding domain-containing protein [Spirochaetales bacterium]